jgi:dynein heavy chain
MFKYYHVNMEVAPKRAALAQAEGELVVVEAKLKETRAGLKAVEDRVAELEYNYDTAVQKQTDLQNQVKVTEVKLERANRLINGLAGEKSRWKENVGFLEHQEGYIVGDTLVAAGSVAYMGPFMAEFRKDLLKTWTEELDRKGVQHGEDVTVTHTTGDPVVIQQWHLYGLPSDPLSVENGIILFNSSRWPLCIDPQGQANAWIKSMQREHNLCITKLSDKDYGKQLENSIRMGHPCLLENVGEELDPMLEPLLLRQTFMSGNTTMIKLGENNVPWDDNFRLFLTTKLPNPHYSPETCVKVGLLNFFITPSGLEDQLLAKIVGKERKDLEDEKKQLTASNAQMAKDLKELQDTILRMLQEAEGDILEQEDLIITLERSKVKSEEINLKVAEAKQTEVIIDEARSKYRPVAFNGSTLFFCVASLSMVDPMYQYSLQWFNNLFLAGIDNAEPSEDLDERLHNLIEYFTYSFYNNVCRSLFEAHKLMFSFSLCIALLRSRNQINELEYRFLLAGPTSTVKGNPNPAPDWLTDQSWSDIQYIAQHLPAFEGFDKEFAAEIPHYRGYFDDADAHRYPIHGDWNDKLTMMEKLIICRCLRADKVVQGMQDYVSKHMDEKFIIPPPFDLAGSFKDSDATSPLIFVLVTGADPMADLLKFADTMKMSKKLHAISLGQGQGKKAEMMIQEGVERGSWVLLQNCHLAVTWMPTLEIIVEHFSPETMKKEFRLWLTSMPSPKFPVSVLQVGVKMTNEPPKGLRNNVTGSYASFTDEYLEDSKQPVAFKKLLFSLLLFHAIIQDRRKFGPLGWNIAYEFTTADLKCNLMQLHHFLEIYDSVPYIVIKFLCGQINYGGRITDDKDRRCIMTMLDGFVDEKIMEDGFAFSESGIYKTVETGNRSYYLDIVKEWPINSAPEVFGLHSNADITCARNETFMVLETVLATQVGSSGGGGLSKDDVLSSLAAEIAQKVPPEFDMAAFVAKYPTVYTQSMNTVLGQEATRFNRLLKVMHRSLKDFGRAIKGEVVMSGELDAMGNSMFINQVPALWAAKAYPSLRPLSSWTEDLIRRCKFIQDWYDNGIPNVFWFSGFYFPQAFLTGSLQNYARKLKISIDTLSFDFIIQKQPADQIQAPEDGVMVDGLSMEGARWDMEEFSIVESRPKELFTDMPVVWLRPLVGRERPEGVYSCPVYKTLRRAGVLSTSGHSTNYVIGMDIPSKKPEAHWIGRGVACFCEVL